MHYVLLGGSFHSLIGTSRWSYQILAPSGIHLPPDTQHACRPDLPYTICILTFAVVKVLLSKVSVPVE